jgi:hypothetical protein
MSDFVHTFVLEPLLVPDRRSKAECFPTGYLIAESAFLLPGTA